MPQFKVIIRLRNMPHPSIECRVEADNKDKAKEMIKHGLTISIEDMPRNPFDTFPRRNFTDEDS